MVAFEIGIFTPPPDLIFIKDLAELSISPFLFKRSAHLLNHGEEGADAAVTISFLRPDTELLTVLCSLTH